MVIGHRKPFAEEDTKAELYSSLIITQGVKHLSTFSMGGGGGGGGQYYYYCGHIITPFNS